MKGKAIVLNKERDVTLSPYIVTHEVKPTFLICPGGGYTNCDESEAIPVAKVFNRLGYNVFVLRYSVGDHYRWPFPLEDFDAAMEYMSAHTNEYYLDMSKIVAAGFSAGGHVVAAAASIAKHKPFAAVLCYGLTSRETLDYCAADAPDACELVNESTCPCFLASSRNDWIVPIFNTTRLIERFEQYYIDYEAHIYGYALHGFSVGKEAGAEGNLFCSRVGNWVTDCLSWLDELVSGRYMSIRECAVYNDTHSHIISTKNSCKRIFSDKKAAGIIKLRFPAQYLLYTAAKAKIGSFLDTVSLRNLLQLMKTSDKTIAKIDDVLAKRSVKKEE